MAMDLYAQAYVRLRAAVLARHFALTNRFRANFLWDTNGLQPLPEAPTEVDRWRVRVHSGDNPLLLGGRLMMCLAIEHFLGRRDALRVLHGWLDAVDSLYVFKDRGGPFAGYFVRWDPALRDAHWIEDGKRRFCDEFYLAQDLHYSYCTPRTDPRSRRPMSRSEWDAASPDERQRHAEAFVAWWDRYRRWEPSMDEVVGLVLGCYTIYALVDDAGVRGKVRDQLDRLGNYLAEHDYLLVRPCGGFSFRGAAAPNPALEVPLAGAIGRITGQSYIGRNTFFAVMDRADVWGALAQPFVAYPAAIASMPVTLPIQQAVAALLHGVGLPNLFDALTGLAVLTSVPLGHLWALSDYRQVFDVRVTYDADRYDDSAQAEFAGAYALMLLERTLRFQSWVIGTKSADRGWARWFPAYLGATALGVRDVADFPLLRSAYLDWLPGRRQAGMIDEVSALASGAGVVLGAGAAEQAALVNLLQAKRQEIGTDLPLDLAAPAENLLPHALDYMNGVALAWLHRKLGHAVAAADFPQLPDLDDSAWPLAAVPRAVRDEVQAGRIALPLDAIQLRKPLQETRDGATDLFLDDPVVAKPAPPAAVWPDETRYLLLSRDVFVAESAPDVPTGITLHPGDVYEVTASGRIRAWPDWAFWFGDNGPEGWDGVEYDAKFPLTGRPDGHAYGLLGRLGGDGAYFFVGARRRERYLGTVARELLLRINDHSPGNGSGAFTCHVNVWRASADALSIAAFEVVSRGRLFGVPLYPLVRFRLTSAVHPRARVTLSVRRNVGPFAIVRSEDPYGGLPPEMLGDWEDREVPANTPDPLALWWLGKTADGPDLRNRNGLYEFRLQAIAGTDRDEATVRVPLMWHGQRIGCVNKARRTDPTRAIQFVGGNDPDGVAWKMSLAEAIAEVEAGQSLYVERPAGDRVEVVVAVSRLGHKYLKTVADGDEPNNLLALPECA